MMANKYSNFLTILLVIVIIAIIIGIGFLVYKFVKPTESPETAIAEFDKNIKEDKEEEEDEEGGETEIDDPDSNTNSNGGSSSGKKKTYYDGHVMIGYIEIPKTGIKYPILEKGTDKSLEVSVAIMYPDNAVLNSPGNVVIMGHNYRNGKFFSDNKKLSTGDKIKITGSNGTVTYTIYEIFETTPQNTSFMNRDTKGKAEITLSTCTDDGSKRLIIKAKTE